MHAKGFCNKISFFFFPSYITGCCVNLLMIWNSVCLIEWNYRKLQSPFYYILCFSGNCSHWYHYLWCVMYHIDDHKWIGLTVVIITVFGTYIDVNSGGPSLTEFSSGLLFTTSLKREKDFHSSVLFTVHIMQLYSKLASKPQLHTKKVRYTSTQL